MQPYECGSWGWLALGINTRGDVDTGTRSGLAAPCRLDLSHGEAVDAMHARWTDLLHQWYKSRKGCWSTTVTANAQCG